MEKKNILKLYKKHSVLGRVRFEFEGGKYLDSYLTEFLEKIVAVSGVKSAKVSVTIGSLLIKYDEEVIGIEGIRSNCEKVIREYTLPIYKRRREVLSIPSEGVRKPQADDTDDILKNILSATATLAYFFINKPPVGRGMISRLFSYRSFLVGSLALPVIKSGFSSLVINKKPNADTLSSSAIIGNLLLGKEKSALGIILLEDLAELITAYTMKKTRKAINGILSAGESFVWKKANNELKKIPVEEVQKDDIVVVYPGEKISVDGEVVDGEALVDQSAITGEYMPVVKVNGDCVFAGTLVKSGMIYIRTLEVGESTAVSRVIKMVEEAAGNRADIENYADSFSTRLVALNFALAGIMYLGTRNLSRALSMLVIDYSCGIKLSTAVAFSSSINKGAQHGILIKGSNYIEALSKINTVIFDKTGTLTKGNPEVLDIKVIEKGVTPEEVIALAAAAEETSTHPLADAILKKQKDMGITIPQHGFCEVFVSKGVMTEVDGSKIYVGNHKFLEEKNVSFGRGREAAKEIIKKGEAIIYVAKDDKLLGILGISDPIRENMKRAINRLRHQGIDNITLLTGDQTKQASIIANKMALDDFKGDLLPEDKAQSVLEYQIHGDRVLMVGDGVNDAPALAYSDVGVSLGSKTTEVADESCDISISRNNPTLIPATIDLSNKTMKTIKENFILSFGINSIALGLGAVGILPALQGSILHNLSTVLVLGNSLKILNTKIEV